MMLRIEYRKKICSCYAIIKVCGLGLTATLNPHIASKHLRKVLSKLWSMSNVCAELGTGTDEMSETNQIYDQKATPTKPQNKNFLLEVYLNTSFSTLLQNFCLPRPVIHKIQAKPHKNTGILFSKPVAL